MNFKNLESYAISSELSDFELILSNKEILPTHKIILAVNS